MTIQIWKDMGYSSLVSSTPFDQVMETPSAVDVKIRAIGWRFLGTFIQEDSVGSFVHYAGPDPSTYACAVYLAHEHRLVLIPTWIDTARFFESILTKTSSLASQTLASSNKNTQSPDQLN